MDKNVGKKGQFQIWLGSVLCAGKSFASRIFVYKKMSIDKYIGCANYF